jgi:hypothetical protein
MQLIWLMSSRFYQNLAIFIKVSHGKWLRVPELCRLVADLFRGFGGEEMELLVRSSASGAEHSRRNLG